MTNKIKCKIMHETRSGPSINLKNINYINTVEKYKQVSSCRSTNSSNTMNSLNKIRIQGKDYFDKHVYLMKDKILENFKRSEGIPLEDRRTIENEFKIELKRLKKNLIEIKESRNKLYYESNIIHEEIEKIDTELEVTIILIILERRNRA